MGERALDKRQMIATLVKSPHGDLKQYMGETRDVIQHDPEFFAHLIAYNHRKGQIRDAKVALPVLALTGSQDPVFVENALAHLADLSPKMFLRATEFARDVKAPTRLIRRLATRYLRDLEADRFAWDRAALQHQPSLRRLYTLWHVAPGANSVRQGGVALTREQAVLGLGSQGKKEDPAAWVQVQAQALKGFWSSVRGLSNLSPVEIAGLIEKYRLPFLTTRGRLGAKAQDPDVVMALMKRMSPTELVTNMKWLEKRGVKTNPALRAQLEESIGKAATSKKKPAATLKTTAAAEALADDEVLSGKLKALQERQLDRIATVEGDWLVLADKSESMERAMDLAQQVSALLARAVKGKVHLVFFDTTPRYFEATGKTYEELKAITRGMTASLATSIGCGLRAIADRGIAVQGIALVSDGCENTGPLFADEYDAYAKRLSIERPTLYWYKVPSSWPQRAIDIYGRQAVADQAASELRNFQYGMQHARIDAQTFELATSADYYSVINLVPTMRVARYALLDELYAMPLRTLDEVLDRTVGMAVLAKAPERVGVAL